MSEDARIAALYGTYVRKELSVLRRFITHNRREAGNSLIRESKLDTQEIEIHRWAVRAAHYANIVLGEVTP